MSVRLEQPVLVVKFDDQLQPGLARASLRNRWNILDGRNPQDVTRQILLAHPKAAVVQVSSPASAAARLISRLRNHWAPIVTVAVAGEATQEAEIEVRRAGVSAFLPALVECESIEGAVESLAPGSVRKDKPVTAHAAAGEEEGRVRAAVRRPGNRRVHVP